MQLESMTLQQSSLCSHHLVRKCAILPTLNVRHFAVNMVQGTCRYVYKMIHSEPTLKQKTLITIMYSCVYSTEFCPEVGVQFSGIVQDRVVMKKEDKTWKGEMRELGTL